jgi:uncharacterized membrane protein
MSTSQDPSQKFHQYDSDDRQLLVGLLHEYSDKLVKASREIARNRTNKKEVNTVLYLLFGFSATFSYLFWNLFVAYMKPKDSSGNYNYHDYNSLYSRVWDNLFLTVLFTSILFFLIVGIPFLKKMFMSSEGAENDLLERDARMIANRLESAMRLTVEISDRVETNLARKLELDLRVDDAASALEYYYSVVNLKPKLKPKPKKSI